VDRTIELILRPGAKIQQGTWRDKWYVCNELNDTNEDDTNEDDNASTPNDGSNDAATTASGTGGGANPKQVLPKQVLPAPPPLPLKQRVALFFSTHYDSVAFREICGIEAVSQLRLNWYLVRMTFTLSVLANAILLPINILDYMRQDPYEEPAEITIVSMTITYVEVHHLWIHVCYTFLLTIVVLATMYALFVDYIGILRETR
jgi:hypothetical protein